MKFRCNTIKFEHGLKWIGVSLGWGTKENPQLNLQFDFFKWAVVFSICKPNTKFHVQ